MAERPRSRTELLDRQAQMMATQDTFSEELDRWIAATAREHCDNFLVHIGEPKRYGEFLYLVQEATQSALLWAVNDLKMELPADLVADAATVAKRKNFRAEHDPKLRSAVEQAFDGVRDEWRNGGSYI